MNYKLLIFDLDGTILNTLEDLTDSTNYALWKNSYPKRTMEEVRRFVGNGIGKLIERAVPEGTSEEMEARVLKDFSADYAIHCADKTRAYDGIKELITDLRKAGCLTAVVSNKADFAVQDLCEQYFPDMFDFVVGERENIRRKPAPDTVFEVLNTLHIDKEEAVYIGDSEVDIKTAQNAGLDIISVAWGFRKKDYLISKGATTIVEQPEEIYPIITSQQ